MRREYINYPPDIPISITFCNIKEYPIHWHNSIEIIYVIDGTLSITIESDTFKLKKNKLEIVNVDESHYLFSDDPNNKILIFHIDPSFFEKYYSDINNILFYVNSSEEDAQETEPYNILRTFLSRMLCELVQRQEGYDEEIKSTLVSLLYHLINNFHYLLYDKDDFKNNEKQLERYHRISKYIFNNYNNITLQEIAQKEFLSSHYLSHEIKYATGYSFTDLVNLTRVEESVKLLLDSDMSISEISEEVGFSHPRYLNKHFKINFKMTPLQFRKRYKVNEKTYEKQKQINILALNDSLSYVLYYLEDYDRFNYENKITKINIDMDNYTGDFSKKFKEILTVGDAFDVLIEDNKDFLQEIQEEIHFTYALLNNVFSTDMGIFPTSKFHNWNRASTVFEVLDSLNLKPLILIDNAGFSDDNLICALSSFFEYFSDLETLNLKDFKFIYSQNVPIKLQHRIIDLFADKYSIDIDKSFSSLKTDAIINPVNDSAYMIPFIINKIINDDTFLPMIHGFDVLDKQVNLTNEVFFGYPGLINDKGIKKPSYYAYYLLNKLGNKIVDKGEGYIVTKNDDGEYQILLYSYNDNINSLADINTISKLRGMKNAAKVNFNLNIVNINSDCRITTYEVNEKVGSSFNYWIEMGKPKRLTKEEKEILHKAAFPRINFKYSKNSAILNLQATLNGYGAELIIIKEVQKHLK